jgi:hypothetical protein
MLLWQQEPTNDDTNDTVDDDNVVVVNMILHPTLKSPIFDDDNRQEHSSSFFTISPYMVGLHHEYTFTNDSAFYPNGDFVQWVKHSGVATSRFPGGNTIKYWDWENPTGQPFIDALDPMFDASLHPPDSTWMSLDEYLAFVNHTGITPIFGVNAAHGAKYNVEDEYCAKAVRMVQYVKERGHGGALWYIGNEEAFDYHGGMEPYAQTFCRYATAMKSVDATIRIFYNDNNPTLDNMRAFLMHDNGTADGLESHGKWYVLSVCVLRCVLALRCVLFCCSVVHLTHTHTHLTHTHTYHTTFRHVYGANAVHALLLLLLLLYIYIYIYRPYEGEHDWLNVISGLDDWMTEVPLRDRRNGVTNTTPNGRDYRSAAHQYRTWATELGRPDLLIADNEYGFGHIKQFTNFDCYTKGLLVTEIIMEHVIGNWFSTCFWDLCRWIDEGLLDEKSGTYRLNPAHLGMQLLAQAHNGTFLHAISGGATTTDEGGNNNNNNQQQQQQQQQQNLTNVHGFAAMDATNKNKILVYILNKSGRGHAIQLTMAQNESIQNASAIVMTNSTSIDGYGELQPLPIRLFPWLDPTTTATATTTMTTTNASVASAVSTSRCSFWLPNFNFVQVTLWLGGPIDTAATAAADAPAPAPVTTSRISATTATTTSTTTTTTTTTSRGSSSSSSTVNISSLRAHAQRNFPWGS